MYCFMCTVGTQNNFLSDFYFYTMPPKNMNIKIYLHKNS